MTSPLAEPPETPLPAESPKTPPPARPSRSRIDQSCEKAALEHLRRGEREEALTILMTCYGTPILTFALRLVHDRELAKDIRQQVFLQAFQNINVFEGRSSLWSWLCGITHHRCLDELKGARRRPVDSVDFLEDVAGSAEPLMDAERVAKQRALEYCLGNLPQALRIQVLMRQFFGLSYTEIAEIVGDSPGTVQVRISRILPRLRQCLNREGVGR